MVIISASGFNLDRATNIMSMDVLLEAPPTEAGSPALIAYNMTVDDEIFSSVPSFRTSPVDLPFSFEERLSRPDDPDPNLHRFFISARVAESVGNIPPGSVATEWRADLKNMSQETAGQTYAGSDVVDIVFGSDFDDMIAAFDLDDWIEGGAGADAIDGGAGSDTAAYTNSMQAVVIDLVNGTADGGDALGDILVSIENLTGSGNDDFLVGDGGANRLEGRDGADTLVGWAGNDLLDGGANPSDQGDVLLGGEGDDTYLVDSALDVVDEGSVPEFAVFGAGGSDTIVSTADFFWDLYSVGEFIQISEDVVDDGGDGVTIVAGVFDNTLIGHSGTDILFGRGGSDTYRPGGGVDYVSFSTLGVTDAPGYVANGVNTLVMEVGNSYDIVFEFEVGRDKVDLEAFDLASTDDLFARGFDDGIGNSYFVLGDGFDYLYLVGLELADLQAGDFIV